MTELSPPTNAALLHEFSVKARALRVQAGLTQGEAAIIAGCSRQTYSEFERGHDCSASTLLGILRAIGKADAVESIFKGVELQTIQRQRTSHRKSKRAW